MGAPLKKNSQESSEAFTATTQQKSTFRRSIFSRFSLALKYYLYERLLYRKQLNKFWELLGGHIFFQTVSSAVELDLFNVLEKNGPSSIEQISFALNLKEQPCRILLLGLVTCGAVSKKKNLYFNSPLAKRFLVSNAPWKLANCFRWQSHINYIPMSRFTEALQSGVNVGLQDFPGNGNTLYERLVSNPEKEKIFQDSMEELSKLSNNQLAQLLIFLKQKLLSMLVEVMAQILLKLQSSILT